MNHQPRLILYACGLWLLGLALGCGFGGGGEPGELEMEVTGRYVPNGASGRAEFTVQAPRGTSVTVVGTSHRTTVGASGSTTLIVPWGSPGRVKRFEVQGGHNDDGTAQTATREVTVEAPLELTPEVSTGDLLFPMTRGRIHLGGSGLGASDLPAGMTLRVGELSVVVSETGSASLSLPELGARTRSQPLRAVSDSTGIAGIPIGSVVVEWDGGRAEGPISLSPASVGHSLTYVVMNAAPGEGLGELPDAARSGGYSYGMTHSGRRSSTGARIYGQPERLENLGFIAAIQTGETRTVGSCGPYRNERGRTVNMPKVVSDVVVRVYDARTAELQTERTFRGRRPRCPRRFSGHTPDVRGTADLAAIHRWLESRAR